MLIQNNSIDQLTQELRKWQEEAQNARDAKTSYETNLNEAQSKLIEKEDLSEKLTKLQTDYESLQKEVSPFHRPLYPRNNAVCPIYVYQTSLPLLSARTLLVSKKQPQPYGAFHKETMK